MLRGDLLAHLRIANLGAVEKVIHIVADQQQDAIVLGDELAAIRLVGFPICSVVVAFG